jgi:hypothetical protein
MPSDRSRSQIFARLTQSKQSEKRIQRIDRTITDPESIRDGEAQIQPEGDYSTARRPQSALVRLRQTGDKPLQRVHHTNRARHLVP